MVDVPRARGGAATPARLVLLLLAALGALQAAALRLELLDPTLEDLAPAHLASKAGAGRTLDPKKIAGYQRLIADLKAAAPAARQRLRVWASSRTAADDEPPPSEANVKKIYFIRHGEGHHNVAQKQWRADPSWDGHSEPYTIDNDPEHHYRDPVLTEKGEREARALQPRCAALAVPELLVVSPMRRAMQTGLYAFESAVRDKRLPVLANELAHERAGLHTCDRRASRTTLAGEFPDVDFSSIASEEDPYWGDGHVRESVPALAARACDFLTWLSERPEGTIAVASHSNMGIALLNAAMDAQDEEAGRWLVTGEMRVLMVTFSRKAA